MERLRFCTTVFVLMVSTLLSGYLTSEAIVANTYISDLQWVGPPVNGWNGAPKLDKANGDPGGSLNPITLLGVRYARGIGCHANSVITYNLGGQYSAFISDIGIDDEVCGECTNEDYGHAVFQVWGDGVKLFDSGTMTHLSPTEHVNVNVTGVKQLQLMTVVPSGYTNNADHTDWAGAYLSTGLASSVWGQVVDDQGTVGGIGKGFSVSKVTPEGGCSNPCEYAISFNPPIAGAGGCTITPFYYTQHYEAGSPVFCVYQVLTTDLSCAGCGPINTVGIGVTCFLITSTGTQVTPTRFAFQCSAAAQ